MVIVKKRLFYQNTAIIELEYTSDCWRESYRAQISWLRHAGLVDATALVADVGQRRGLAQGHGLAVWTDAPPRQAPWAASRTARLGAWPVRRAIVNVWLAEVPWSRCGSVVSRLHPEAETVSLSSSSLRRFVRGAKQ